MHLTVRSSILAAAAAVTVTTPDHCGAANHAISEDAYTPTVPCVTTDHGARPPRTT